MNSCDPLALAAAISALATALAETMTDDELNLTSAALTQLGDTLATIAVQRGICERKSAAAK